MNRLLLAAVVPLLVVAGLAASRAPTASAASSFTIKTSGGAVARLGSFRPRQDPSPAAAVRTFGQPSSRTLLDDNACSIEWRRLRLKILFANYGGTEPGQTTCTDSSAQSFTVRGRRFRTWEGLRVRHRSSTIPERHKAADFRQGSWWLRTAVSPYGDNAEYAVVNAVVKRGRVQAIAGWVGAAGE